ncbi:MAG TPA: hypothetical protein EYO33_27715 [Phycisphaerales bacterium]|nr:hypothetical protein [Phycisphaerales bacterium]
MQPISEGRRAFSVIEVIVAFGLLSIMVAIFFNLIPSSTLASLRAENRLSASNIAQNELETLRSGAFSDLAAANGRVRTERRGSTQFKVETQVEDIAGTRSDYIKLAKVKVTWAERQKNQSLSYELRIFNQKR